MNTNKPNDLTGVNPGAHYQKFVINKDVRDLETIRKTFKPNSPTVLNSVRDFLPKLAAANDDIQKQLELDPASVCIENVEDGESHVEMNIALVEQSDESEFTDTSESDDDEIQQGEVTEDNIRLQRHQECSSKVLIQCCSDDKQKDMTDRPNTDQVCTDDETHSELVT